MSLTNKKEAVLSFLVSLRQKAYAEDEPFKARAYTKAIKEIQMIPKLNSIEDVTDVPGIGAKIKEKIQEILLTGSLVEASVASVQYNLDSYNSLQGVYGIGPAKARELIEKRGIKSIEDLRSALLKDSTILTLAQKTGLNYVEDLNERIPRKEMTVHETYVRKHLPTIFDMVVVGSYRRGLPNSGDIDVMITTKKGNETQTQTQTQTQELFKGAVDGLEASGYIKAYFVNGTHKFMGVCRLPRYQKHRHIDILLCDPAEYWYTILYFTGSDVFNVSMRRYAITKGYSLSEHGLKVTRAGVPQPPIMTSEKDIFDFLGLQYVNPEERNLPLPY
jgi:DNA polymerase/3'-5' exonuclease PolX